MHEAIIEQNNRAERDSLPEAARRAGAGAPGNEIYYLALRRTQTTIGDEKPDWDSWLHFFLHCLQRQTVRLQERLAREADLQATLSPLAARLARLFNTNETLTLSEAATQLHAKPNTLKTKFRELLSHDLIQRKGNGRGTYYTRK